jgi:hypothetical protein
MSNLEWLPERRGGSRFGWHFLSNWSKCQTYWYNSTLRPHPGGQPGHLGIEAASYSPALDIGSRFHKGLEAYFAGYDVDSVLSAHRSLLEQAPGAALDGSTPQADSIATADRLLVRYMDRYHPTRGTHPDSGREVLAIERELAIDVGYQGYVFTARLDLVWSYAGYIWALEHKTTSAQQYGQLLKRIHLDGQFTGQYWLLTEHYPDQPVGGVTCDIAVKDRGGKSGLPEFQRVDTSRTPEQLEKFRLDVARKLDQIEHAVGDYRELLSKGVESGAAAELVFDGSPDGYQCVGTFGKCDFYDLCLNRRQASFIVKSDFKPREYKYGHENPFTEPASAPVLP